MEKNQEINQCLAIFMLTGLQSGKPVEPKFGVNKLGVKIPRVSKKRFCEDLDEGNCSLPLIHLLKHTDHQGRIASPIYNRTRRSSSVRLNHISWLPWRRWDARVYPFLGHTTKN